MRVAIIGGSGRLGSALAWRLAGAGWDVIIGSRTAAGAVNAAGLLAAACRSGALVEGARNRDAARAADVVVLAVPACGHAAMLHEIAPAMAGRVAVDACVCHHPRRPGLWLRPTEGSAALRVRRLLPRSAAVAAALHTVGARNLRAPDRHPPGDVLVAADSPGGQEAGAALARALGLDAIDSGDLGVSAALEQLAIVLARLADRHGVPAPGWRLVGLDGLPGRTAGAARGGAGLVTAGRE